jgi:hypothetical protein
MPTRCWRYIVFVQNGWSSGTIEQNGDASGTAAHSNNDASLVSKFSATSSSKVAHFESGTDSNSIQFLIHGPSRNETTSQETYENGCHY